MTSNAFAQADVQIIHNSADPAAEVVDIYVEDDNGDLLDSFIDVAFRTATPFLEIPAGDYDITVAPAGSSGPEDGIATFPVTLQNDESYTVVANGVLDPSDFASNPDGVTTAFDLDIATGARSTVADTDGDVEIRAVHGATDAPEVDVFADGSLFAGGLTFRDISGYLDAPAAELTLDVAPAGAGAGNAVASFEVDLGPFADTPLTVLASGFLDPSNQTPSPVAPFTLIAVAPDGTVIDLGASQFQLVHNSADPAAEVVDVYIDGTLAADDFTFRTATGFLSIDSGVRELAVAPGNSTDVSDAIFTTEAQVPINESLTVVANGVLDPSDFASNPDGVTTAFDLDIATGARSTVADTDGDVEIRAVHGATDAPEVDVFADGSLFAGGLTFRDISGYLDAPAAELTLDVAPAGAGAGNAVASFEVDLGPFADTPLTVLASGFLDPSNQIPAPVAPFTLIAVAPDGTVINLGSDLIINEFLANPDGADTNNDGSSDNSENQFVELLNISTTESIDVSGYSIETGSGSYSFPADGPTLDPGTGLVVFGGGSPSGFEVFADTGLPNLDSGNGDTITLSNDAGAPLQIVSFEADSSPATPTATLEESVVQSAGVSTARDESGTFVLHTDIAPTISFSPGEDNVSGAPLPVELTGFNGQVDGSTVLLTWTTLSETNNSGFEVQQRIDRSFERIGFKEGQGTTNTETSYSFTVSDLDPGTHTFRLKQIDLDGSPTLSEPIEVDVALSDAFTWTQMAPNPVASRGSIELQVKESQDVTVALFDVLGRRVTTLHEGRMDAGESHQLSVEGQSLSSGVYFLRVEGERFSDTQRISVVR